MKNLVPALAIVAYCVFSALPLFQTWWNFPTEKFSWLGFIIWLVPLGLARAKQPSVLFLCLALVATLLGTLGSLNVLKYVGLACALASFVRWSWAFPLWLLSALVWMPVYSVLGAHIFPLVVIPLKLCIPLLTSSAVCLSKEKKTDE